MQHPKDLLNPIQYLELQKAVDQLILNHSPLQIILFGLTQYNSARHNCLAGPEHLTRTHYFLLLMTSGEKRLLHRVQEYTTPGYHNVHITTLSCGKRTIEKWIRKEDRFFNTLLNDGVSLYHSTGMQSLHSWKPDFFRIQFNAQRHYEIHWRMGMGFTAAARSAMDEEDENPGIAVLFLHQAAVQACLMLIKVSSGLKPPTRSLKKLLELCLCFEPYLSIHFKQDTDEEIRLFKVFVNAYVFAIHEDEFEATIADAELLMEQVDEFMVMVEVFCDRRLKEIQKLLETSR